MTRRIKFTIIGVIGALLVVVWYSPTLLYLAYSIGLGIARSELDGKYLDLEKWWVPVQSPNSILEPVLGNKKRKSITFIKANGVLPGVDGMIIVSQVPAAPATLAGKGQEIRLPIGTAFLYAEDPKESGQWKHFVIREHGLLVTTRTPESLYAIKAIQLMK